MKHLEIEQLKKYGERGLSGDEVTQAVLHLDECAACFDSFEKMFPALSDRAREVSPGDLTADDGEVFHLDYDEHLRPYVDFEMDETTREIVESHLQNCLFCERAVRELREFSDSLRLRQIKKDGFAQPEISGAIGYRLSRFLTGNSTRLILPAMAILILGIGGWLFWQSETPNPVAEIQTLKDEPKVAANENSFNRQPENLPANLETKRIESANSPREVDSANVKSDSIANENLKPNHTEDERLLAALPPDFRVQFQNAARTQRIKLPAFIAELREETNLRGASGGGKNIVLSPDAQAVKSSQPTFSWRKFAADGENYVVTIYDEDFNPVAISPNLRGAKWQPNVPLKRGKIYRWQVAAGKSSETYAGQFKVLDENALVRLKAIENAAPNSPLALGIGYAAEGLLIEAGREFEKEIKRNPPGNLARKLKKSLVRNSKR